MNSSTSWAAQTTKAGGEDFNECLKSSFVRKPVQPALEWMEQNYRVRSGRFRARGYQRGWIHLWANLNIPQKTLIAGVQMGKTDGLKGWKEWSKIERGRRVGLWLVRGLDVTRYSAIKLNELYALNPKIAEQLEVDDWRTKGPTNNTNIRVYRNGAIEYIYASQSATNFTDITCDDVVSDEFDKQPDDVEGQGAPDLLAFGRTDGVDSPNQICLGTLDEANAETGKTKLTARSENSDCQLVRKIKCQNKFCDRWHPLFWGGEDVKGGFKFDRKNVGDKFNISATAQTIRHECPSCGHEIRYNELEELDMHHAEYRSDDIRMDDYTGELTYIDSGLPAEQDLKSIAQKTPGFFNYKKPWSQGLAQFLEAVRTLKTSFDEGPLKTVMNEWFAEVFVNDKDDDVVAWTILQGRSYNFIERFGAECPPGVQYITAAMDLHEGGEHSEPFVAAEIIGWGYGFENWSLGYIDEEGDCLTSDVVERVAKQIVQKQFMKKNGAIMSISCCAIDAGWQGDIAYAYQRSDFSFWIPVMGARRYGQPIYGGWPDKPNDKGAHVVYMGTDTGKDQIYAGFNTAIHPGPGYSNFPCAKTMPGKEHYNDDYYKGVVSEVVRVKDGRRKYERKSTHIRNEPLDLRNMNFCMMHFLMSIGAVFEEPEPDTDSKIVMPSLSAVQQHPQQFSAPAAEVAAMNPRITGRRQHKKKTAFKRGR